MQGSLRKCSCKSCRHLLLLARRLVRWNGVRVAAVWPRILLQPWSLVSVTDQTPQNLSEADSGNTPQNDGSTAGGSPPEKPAWLFDDALFDAEKGVNVEALGARAKELHDWRAEQERIANERKASVPEKPDDYGIAFPEGFEMPKDFQVDENAKDWGVLRQLAHEAGLSKDQYAKAAAAFVNLNAEKAAAEKQLVEQARSDLIDKLGARGAERMEAIKKSIPAIAEAFGDADDVAVLKEALPSVMFIPQVARFFENVGKALSSGGVPSFNGNGRVDDGGSKLPEGWEKMTFEQRWHYANSSQQARR